MKEELARLFKIEIIRGRKTTYSIGPLIEINEDEELRPKSLKNKIEALKERSQKSMEELAQ